MSDIALSLGAQPISNRLPRQAEQSARYPLDLAICDQCGLAQLAHHIDADEHFHDDYTYISGASKTWVEHCASYAEDVTTKYGVEPGALVVEIGSNDGTLLKALQKQNHNVLGIEPSKNVAEMANEAGARTISAFFNKETAEKVEQEYGKARILIGNNVLAHVPDTNAFLKAARDLIAADGALCFEFPHFIKIVEKMYFDTIYHEHYGYLGVGPLAFWAERNGMIVADVEEQSTHGGTLRVLLKHKGNGVPSSRVAETIEREKKYFEPGTWRDFAQRLEAWRGNFRGAIAERKREGKKVVGYAAASKATVLLNYVGLTVDDIDYCCDASPLKQDRFIPGGNIPIVSPETLATDPPDVIVVFAWNIFDEITDFIGKHVASPTEVINPFPDISSTVVAPGS